MARGAICCGALDIPEAGQGQALRRGGLRLDIPGRKPQLQPQVVRLARLRQPGEGTSPPRSQAGLRFVTVLGVLHMKVSGRFSCFCRASGSFLRKITVKNYCLVTITSVSFMVVRSGEAT